MNAKALDQMRDCIVGSDASFLADVTECIDDLVDPNKRWPKNPKLLRAAIESLVEQAIEYGRHAATPKSQGGAP